MNSGQGVNYEVSRCVLITAESDAVPVYQSLAGIVFCFRIITSRARGHTVTDGEIVP